MGGAAVVGCGSGFGGVRSGSSRKSRNSGGVSGIVCCAPTLLAANMAHKAVVKSAFFMLMNAVFSYDSSVAVMVSSTERTMNGKSEWRELIASRDDMARCVI